MFGRIIEFKMLNAEPIPLERNSKALFTFSAHIQGGKIQLLLMLIDDVVNG
jgi:hypothetical protein